ncbi:hypothetical protein C6Q22_06830 [Burkholderia multivorans]|nr:hypothetical protein C6Q22_06830 [Burkholderia multivorans]
MLCGEWRVASGGRQAMSEDWFIDAGLLAGRDASRRRYGAARHGTARHGTARHGTARHGTARRSTSHRCVRSRMQQRRHPPTRQSA